MGVIKKGAFTPPRDERFHAAKTHLGKITPHLQSDFLLTREKQSIWKSKAGI